MAVFNSFTFDGINSLDSGVYITGQAVFNAPERVVEMVTVPGRNGALALDQGRFENIEVTYHAGCFADSQADFADKVMRFRNALASRYTYKRLTDEYHPDEYRLGLYKSGLDVDAVRYGTAGEFNIVFDCKPQRFLIDGDRAISPTEWSDVQTESGELVTIDSDGSLAVKSLEVSLEPIQAGSGEPSPENVRPISGRTEVVTRVAGVNVWDEVTEFGYISNTTGENLSATTQIRGKNYISVKPNTSYYFKSPNGVFVYFYGANKEYIGAYGGGTRIRNNAITLGANVYFIRISMPSDYGTTYNNDISINYPSADHDYHAYDGHTYTTSLGQTVYGGTLDVVSGVLTVDRLLHTVNPNGIASVTPLTNNVRSGLYRPQALADNPSTGENADAISNLLPRVVKNYNADVTGFYFFDATGVYIKLPKASLPTVDLTGFRQFLTDHPMEIVYPLATPQTYQLTPQQIDLLLGTNHLWSDGSITVTYGTHPLYNPTQFESRPLLVVTGKGILQIGDYVLTIVGRENQTIYIDCESQEAWEVVGAGKISRNDYIRNAGEEFPVLVPGINNISLGSGITAVTITPRWWRI